MSAVMKLWTTGNSNLYVVQLEKLSVWFYRGTLVAFGDTDGRERFVNVNWGESMGSSAHRELDRMSDHGSHPVLDPDSFEYRYNEKVGKKLKDFFSVQRELAITSAKPPPLTRVSQFSVHFDGDNEVEATARVETSLDGGQTWLSAELDEPVLLADWGDDSIVKAGDAAKKKLLDRITAMGFAVPSSMLNAARVNI